MLDSCILFPSFNTLLCLELIVSGRIEFVIVTQFPYRYLAGVDGLKRLQTVRLDDEHLVTPELNTYSSSSSSSLNDSATQ